jgi:hypothetical protein
MEKRGEKKREKNGDKRLFRKKAKGSIRANWITNQSFRNELLLINALLNK